MTHSLDTMFRFIFMSAAFGWVTQTSATQLQRQDSESIDEIPERRDEEERYLAEEQEVFHQGALNTANCLNYLISKGVLLSSKQISDQNRHRPKKLTTNRHRLD